MSKNFSLRELTNSTSAAKYKINNTIPAKYMDNVTRLMEMLEVVRGKYGKPIIVSSGYRCKELNARIGGAQNSDHTFAAAADIRSVSDSSKDNKELFDTIVKLAKEGKIHCRQIIDEYNYNWVHVSVNHPDNKTKDNQVLHIK